ncbi:uncharacterized protein LOC133554811 isoform X1 [Nerophis ophidion]|uniref:uncharacterized protein LOC133554811 isoform X1 n=1 Tax=Nerophis ophidion TaxID=159077 RepID=UPI002AE07A8C|nr:uncharacterized protein LOC133554811 isoform X1 [Nerophis ophidion]
MHKLNNKSAQEISDLLDEYGIKHGPVVESTRNLYMKKLREAMVNPKRAAPSDKTYYREEEEEVTYLYRTPTRSNVPEDNSRLHMRSRPEWTERETEQEHYTYNKGYPYTNSTPKTSREAPPEPESTRFIPLWVQLVFFLIAAVFLYLVFSSMETNAYTNKLH